ncbi:MAG: FAD-binding oxidoreductase [Actinomycetota bacterium]|nr:FAD-binding oxidoreductase [Actinomycetota bacterium]
MSMIVPISDLPAAAVFAPETPDQVALALARARMAGQQVVVVASCHGLPPIGDLSESMLLDMSNFDEVRIDPGSGVARVGGGVDWRRLVTAAAPLGLTGPFGSSATVGITGFMMGGGIGPFSRHLGLAANSMLAAEIVTPDGIVRRIDAESDPDLFWALRGGGGGFGVITALEFQLTRMTEMSGGLMIWSLERAREVVPVWAEWTRRAPGDLTSSVRMVDLPDGTSLLMLLATAPRSAGSLLADLDELDALAPIQNTIGNTDPVSFLEAYSDPDESGPPPAIEHVLLDLLTPDAVEQAVEFIQPGSGCGATMIELRHLGGALATAPRGSGAQGHVDGNFSLFVMGAPEAAPGLAHAVDVLSDFGRGRTYFNFMTIRGNREYAFSPEAHRRLAQLYEAVDPDGLMNHPQPLYDRLRPAPAGADASAGPPNAENRLSETHPVPATDHRPPAGGHHRQPAVGAGS